MLFFTSLFRFFKGSNSAPADGVDSNDQPTVESFTETNDYVAEELYKFSQKLIDERNALHERNADLKGRLRIAEQMLEERPAVWIPDEDRRACFSCDEVFTVFNRRHHCRECGEVFDAKCCFQSKTLPGYPGMGPQRVCNDCFEGNVYGLDLEDLDSSALIALGFGGTRGSESFETSIEQASEPPVKPRPRKPKVNVATSCTGCSMCAAKSEPSKSVQKSATGRIRSEIPPAPPLPAILPGALTAPAATAGPPAFLKAIQKTKKPTFVPPANAAKRIDFDELQKGISRLKKAAISTPKKPAEDKPDAIAELRLSLRRRRRALEDSAIASPKGSPTEPTKQQSSSQKETGSNENENHANATPLPGKGVAKGSADGMKAMSLMDGLRETVVFRESIGGSMNTSMNSSWVE